MIEGIMTKKGLNINFLGDFREFVDFDRDSLIEYTSDFLSKSNWHEEILDLEVYIRKFKSTYLNRPLVFCNVAANTEFGIMSGTGTSWGIRPALKDALKNVILEMQKISEKQLYGEYADSVDEVFA